MKLLFALLALLVALTLVVLYLAYPIVVAIRTSKGIVEAAVPFERDVPNASMRILIAGDSTGVGVGATRPEESVAGRIATRYPHASVENISVTGMRIAGLRATFESKEPKRYSLMVIHIGANDVTGRTPLPSIERDLRAVLSYAEAHSDTTIMLTAGNIGLAPPFKAPVSWYLTNRTLQVRELFMRTTEQYKTVHYVDLFKPKEEDVFSTDIPRYYAPDRFHPSSDGYATWYAATEPILNDVLP